MPEEPFFWLADVAEAIALLKTVSQQERREVLRRLVEFAERRQGGGSTTSIDDRDLTAPG